MLERSIMISSFEKSLRASGILASDISIIKEIMMLGFLIPVNSVVFIPNDGLVAFHYSSYGTFCLHSKSSIISTVVLPTTEIIEPINSQPLSNTHQTDSKSFIFIFMTSNCHIEELYTI